MVEVARTLLDHGHKPNQRNFYGMTPLLLACEYGHLEVASLILSKGADANYSDPGGYTPLHLAVEQSHLNLVRLLLRHDAQPNAPDAFGSTPLHVSAKFRSSGFILDCLIGANADQHRLDADMQSPLQIATYYHDTDNLALWQLDPRSRWGGNSTNFEKMLASRIGHRHTSSLNHMMESSVPPPPRPRTVEPPPTPRPVGDESSGSNNAPRAVYSKKGLLQPRARWHR